MFDLRNSPKKTFFFNDLFLQHIIGRTIQIMQNALSNNSQFNTGACVKLSMTAQFSSILLIFMRMKSKDLYDNLTLSLIPRACNLGV